VIQNSPDTVIVGAGAAGLQLAARLAEAGESVVVLEAGPQRSTEDMVSSQIWARKLKWSGAAVEESGTHPVGHAFNAGSGTGGSAAHHYGVWLRLHPEDFSVQSDHKRSLDWPLTYNDLQPYYDRVQDSVGLSGDHQAEVWRPPGAPYPMPPLPVFAQGRILDRGFQATGRRTSPLPLAINSVPRNGRAPCQFDGWCDAGCPIGALANPLVTSLPRALSAGADIRYGAQALRVLRDPGNARNIRGLEYVQHGERKQLNAKRFIIAAFTVQTSRLLLNSGNGKHAAPGNQHDQLGRYLTTHPAGTIFGLFDDETTPHLGVSGGQLLSHDDYANKDQTGGFGSSQWLIANAIKPHDLLGYGTSRPDITGAALRPWLERAAKYLANMTLVVEDISSADNRVTLSDARDDAGMPKAHTHHDIDPDAAARWQQRIAEGEEIFRAAGATEVWHGPRVAMHIMGGTVMGSDEKKSVTDEFGRVHDTDNLYVSGPSLFPSSGAVNPTFTLSALAERQADYLLDVPLATAPAP